MKLKIENLFSGYDEDVVLKDLSLEVGRENFCPCWAPPAAENLP